jgi:hypothetical protein
VYGSGSVTRYTGEPTHLAFLQMLPEVFWCIVIMPSVEGADQRGAAQIDRADKGPP